MTAITLNGSSDKSRIARDERTDGAQADDRPLALRVLECLAIIGVPLAIVVVTVTAMMQFH
ncbi:MAG TPA: hypothetical protein VMG55_02945 [Stellaceae bacterium]|nr:hypothetical protein [Stellaceae bacterium]